jgi:hypothetical protein
MVRQLGLGIALSTMAMLAISVAALRSGQPLWATVTERFAQARHGGFGLRTASPSWLRRDRRRRAVQAVCRHGAGMSDSITRSWTIAREIRRRHLIAEPLAVVRRTARLELDARVARAR